MKNGPKLLQVTTIPATLRDFMRPFGSHFRAQGWRVDAMACGVSECPECVQAFDRVWEVQWSRNPLDVHNLAVAPRRLRETVEQVGYDLVHVHTPVAAFVTRYALRGLRKTHKPKVLYTAHGFHFYRGGQPLKNLVFLALEKLAGRWTDYLVVINHEDEEAAARFRLVPPGRVRYMPGIGVETQRFGPGAVSEEAALQVRRELRLEGEEPLFLMTASFTPGKCQRDVLKALARLARPAGPQPAGVKAHLALAGRGPLMKDSERLADELGIAEQVHLLGYRPDVPTLLRAATASLLISEREGLSRSVMESLSMGVPVIGTDIRGVRDLLDGECGLLVPLGDIQALAEAMRWMLTHPAEARAMGCKGRKKMQGAYEVRNILALHETLYQEALGTA
jgi:glycosyltransferase involved in cell wall biosynthesis